MQIPDLGARAPHLNEIYPISARYLAVGSGVIMALMYVVIQSRAIAELHRRGMHPPGIFLNKEIIPIVGLSVGVVGGGVTYLLCCMAAHLIEGSFADFSARLTAAENSIFQAHLLSEDP